MPIAVNAPTASPCQISARRWTPSRRRRTPPGRASPSPTRRARAGALAPQLGGDLLVGGELTVSRRRGSDQIWSLQLGSGAGSRPGVKRLGAAAARGGALRRRRRHRHGRPRSKRRDARRHLVGAAVVSGYTATLHLSTWRSRATGTRSQRWTGCSSSAAASRTASSTSSRRRAAAAAESHRAVVEGGDAGLALNDLWLLVPEQRLVRWLGAPWTLRARTARCRARGRITRFSAGGASPARRRAAGVGLRRGARRLLKPRRRPRRRLAVAAARREPPRSPTATPAARRGCGRQWARRRAAVRLVRAPSRATPSTRLKAPAALRRPLSATRSRSRAHGGAVPARAPHAAVGRAAHAPRAAAPEPAGGAAMVVADGGGSLVVVGGSAGGRRDGRDPALRARRRVRRVRARGATRRRARAAARASTAAAARRRTSRRRSSIGGVGPPRQGDGAHRAQRVRQLHGSALTSRAARRPVSVGLNYVERDQPQHSHTHTCARAALSDPSSSSCGTPASRTSTPTASRC